MSSVQVSTRIDSSVREEASRVLAAQGLDIPSALRIFLNQTAQTKSVPLSLNPVNRELLARQVQGLSEDVPTLDVDLSDRAQVAAMLEGWDEY